MQIETYEIEEHTTEGRDPFEVDAEAQALIDTLGLEGQRELLRPSKDPDVKTLTRIPYQIMTLQEVRVYEELYPEKSQVAKYRAGPIPLRVLQVIAHCQTLDFDRVEVWGPKTKDPDPVLVGVLKKPGPDDHYLLARWGDALEPFERLHERAVESLTRRWKANAERVIAECRAFIEAPAGHVNKKLAGDWIHEPWV